MKTTLQILLGCFLTASASAEFRTWTRNDGKTAELDLISVTEVGGEKSGEFKMRNGRTVTLSATSLSEADAKLLDEWKPAEAAAAATPSAPSVFDEVLDRNLEILDGRKLKRHELASKPTKHYVFYYTASWCGPCQAYTPDLVKFYNKAKKDNDSFELVLITSDRDEDSMEGYAKDKKMPWPHLKFSKAKEFKSKFQHGVTGIPSVIICDLEGNIVSRSRSISDIEKILK
jgi:thiol-disulfide isomerase/thioredoxin